MRRSRAPFIAVVVWMRRGRSGADFSDPALLERLGCDELRTAGGVEETESVGPHHPVDPGFEQVDSFQAG